MATGAPTTHRAEADPDALERLVAEQSALLRVARAVAQGVDPGEVLGLVAREVALILDAEAGIVWRFTPEGSLVVGSFGEHRSQLGEVFPTDGDGAVAVVARTGVPARAEYGALPAGDPTAARVVGQGYVSGVAAPVSVDGRPWGAVLAARTSHAPLPVDAERRLGSFAELVSLAIANAQAREELAQRATTDILTGALNQGEFHRRIDQELSRARRHGDDLALAVLDLDHFKSVNDTLGHQVGDRVLAAAAREIRRTLREGDALARVGGEEFALILPATDLGGAAEAAERARAAVAAMDEPDMPSVTLSAGVAAIDGLENADQLFAAADRALYRAKRSGRDRVCTRDGQPEHTTGAEGVMESANPVRALALAVEAKDPATHRHSERVAGLVRSLALACGWEPDDARALGDCALVHDVGKIGLPDAVLLKRGPLTRDEYERVKVHPELGARIAEEVLGPDAVDWIRHHHERFDGLGYPGRLAGPDIPAGARLLAVADAFDVMITGRSYACAKRPDQALAEIRELAGAQFCPEAVRALERVLGAR